MRPLPFVLPLLTSAMLTSSIQTSAQELLGSWDLGVRRGRTLHLVADTDNDGLPEFLIGDFSHNRGNLDASGTAFIVQTADASVPFEVFGTEQFQSIGAGLGTVGDVDGDGSDDFAVSGHIFPVGSFSQLQIFSGRDRKLLFERNHPALGLASLGDLNGDGKDDFLLGDPVYGIVSLMHGGTFEVKHEWYSTGGALGISIAVLGDLDADGTRDFAAGAPGGSIPFGTWPGKVQAFSSGDHAQLFERFGEGVTEQFGRSIAGPGDLNGDGVNDLIVAGPGCCSSISEFDGPGRLYFFDVRNDVLLGTLDPDPNERGFGIAMDEAGDVDGNGVGDVLVFVSRSINLSVDVVEGATRRRIGRVPGSTALAGGGHDWNGDSVPDFAVLRPEGSSNEIRVYSGAPPGVRILGSPCARGPEPRIGCTGSARLGAELPIHLSNVAPGRFVVLVLGQIDTLAVPGTCRPRLRSLRNVALHTAAVSPGKGAATVPLAIPNDPSLQGRTFHAQWILPHSSGQLQSTSRVLAIEILAP
jgi:hypothetical protein